MKFDLTPDAKHTLVNALFTGGCILPRIPGALAHADLSAHPAYTALLDGFAHKFTCEHEVNTSWLAWYEAADELLKTHVEDVRELKKRDKKNPDVKLHQNEYDTFYVGNNFTGLFALNHYLRTRHSRVTWWWKAGMLSRNQPRLKLRYTPHVILAPVEYTLWSQLQNVYNRSTHLKAHTYIFDALPDQFVPMLVNTLEHLRVGNGVLIKTPLLTLMSRGAAGVIMYVYRELFRKSTAWFSPADLSVTMLFEGLTKAPSKVLIGYLTTWVTAGKEVSPLADSPGNWDEFCTNYENFLVRMTEVAKKWAADEKNQENPPDHKKFAEFWHHRHEIVKIDARLHLVRVEDAADD